MDRAGQKKLNKTYLAFCGFGVGFFFFFNELVRSTKLNNFAESEFAFSGVPTQSCQPDDFQNKVRCQHIISTTFSFRLLPS